MEDQPTDYKLALESGPAHSSGNRAMHPSKRDGPDLYETPPCCTEVLLKNLLLPKKILEPCAGRFAITKVLEAHGHEVDSFDLHDHVGDGRLGGFDFLRDTPDTDANCIVSNPPYKYTVEFVERGLQLVDTSYWLMRIQFIKSTYAAHVIEHCTGFYPITPRPPRMNLDGYTGKKVAATMDVAWYRFDRYPSGGKFWKLLDLREIR